MSPSDGWDADDPSMLHPCVMHQHVDAMSVEKRPTGSACAASAQRKLTEQVRNHSAEFLGTTPISCYGHRHFTKIIGAASQDPLHYGTQYHFAGSYFHIKTTKEHVFGLDVRQSNIMGKNHRRHDCRYASNSQLYNGHIKNELLSSFDSKLKFSQSQGEGPQNNQNLEILT